MIRPADARDADQIADVIIRTWRTTYTGIVPDAYIKSMSSSEIAQAWRDRFLDADYGVTRLTLVAEDEPSGVFGFISGGPERTGDPDFSCEVYAIYLLQSQQGVGTGAKLFGELARWLHTRGHQSMLVWALAANPACGFYETMGGMRSRERTHDIGGVSLPEVGFGWRSLAMCDRLHIPRRT